MDLLSDDYDQKAAHPMEATSWVEYRPLLLQKKPIWHFN
jgi:hypothetical protein